METTEVFTNPDDLFRDHWIAIARKGVFVAWDDVSNSGVECHETSAQAKEHFAQGVIEHLQVAHVSP